MRKGKGENCEKYTAENFNYCSRNYDSFFTGSRRNVLFPHVQKYIEKFGTDDESDCKDSGSDS